MNFFSDFELSTIKTKRGIIHFSTSFAEDQMEENISIENIDLHSGDEEANHLNEVNAKFFEM